MSKPIRFGSAVSFVALATLMAGCAAPQQHASSVSGQSGGEVGLAMRAMAALSANNIPAGVDFAERAVANTPKDANVRALLGSAYFAAGRFASAEAAFKDSLSINANQPQVALKLILVEIAQGKNSEATALLESGRGMLDPADYGLALALAGHSAEAVDVLQTVARADGADARVRQNLALAYAFSGDWVNARAVAEQDVPADQIDTRIHQWMQLASPAHPSDQVAALIGVTPAASDPGQPIRLALNLSAAPLQADAVPVAPVSVAEAVPAAPAQVAEAAPAPAYEPAPPPVMAQSGPQPAFETGFVEPPPARMPAKARRVSSAPVVHASLRSVPLRHAVGNSSAVVQLGAYGNALRVAAAWSAAAHKFGALKAYTPLSARFDSAKGPVYRLSVKGFASDREARAVCESLRNSGGSCFVRTVAGDRPVQLASR